MDRRTVLKGIGASAIAASLAGCEGVLDGDDGGGDGGDGGTDDDDDDFFGDIEEEVVDENMTDPLEITSSELYRAASGFGVMGTVTNTADEAVGDVEVHVELNDPDEVIGEFVDDFGEENELGQIPPGNALHFDVNFQDTEPSEVEEAVNYRIWATGEIQ